MVRNTEKRSRQELVSQLVSRLEAMSDEELAALVDNAPGTGLTLADLLPVLASRGKHSIMELEGLGADFWRTIDVEEYIRRERASWGS